MGSAKHTFLPKSYASGTPGFDTLGDEGHVEALIHFISCWWLVFHSAKRKQHHQNRERMRGNEGCPFT